MSKFLRINFLTIILISLFFCDSVRAQLTANAGSDKTVCPGASTIIGGGPAATGGKAPYTYSWSPSNFLSSTSSPNPTSTPLGYVTYTLTVTDDTGAVASDMVIVALYYISNVDAGNDISICVNGNALLGGALNIAGAGVSYSWSPAISLDNSTLPRPTSTPLLTTTYTLIATSAACPAKTDQVTVTIIPTPLIDAGPDATIQEGEVVMPTASGGFFYAWGNGSTITYPYTSNPNLEPLVTTTYYLYGTDITNTCPGYDSMVVNVIPNDELVFYNTFTPNNDGNNDTWYIGNIYKYPDNKLEIFNRDGKEVFKTSKYINNWDGKAFGDDLPAGTYFYIMDLGDGKGKRHGTVTIIK